MLRELRTERRILSEILIDKRIFTGISRRLKLRTNRFMNLVMFPLFLLLLLILCCSLWNSPLENIGMPKTKRSTQSKSK